MRLAKTGPEVIKWVERHEPLDLLIIDPDLPDTNIVSLLKILKNRIPALPVLVHTLLADSVDFEMGFIDVVWVEKSGSSVESLKRIVANILKNPILSRFKLRRLKNQ